MGACWWWNSAERSRYCRRHIPTPDPTPFLQLTNVGSPASQQGIYDIALDPNFTTNHFYYIFYTAGIAEP